MLAAALRILEILKPGSKECFLASAEPNAILEAYKKKRIVDIEGSLDADQVQRFNDEVQPALEKLTIETSGNDFQQSNTSMNFLERRQNNFSS